MTTQTEQALENNPVSQLEELGYFRVQIKDAADLTLNLKEQLEKINNIEVSDKELQKVLNHLDKVTVLERAHPFVIGCR